MKSNINDYKVYIHIFPNNKVYIGITLQKPEYRWRKGNRYNNYMNKAVEKYGWENIKHKILYEHLTKEEAEQKEIELIAQYKSNQKEFGYNIANGGNHNGKHSEETKIKISNANKGKKSPCGMLNKHHSKETKEKMSISRTGKVQSKETIEKRIKKLRIKVNQYDLDGNFIKTWDSITTASLTLHIKDSDISRVCKGKRNMCGGYVWKYANE